jgi:hypothetical protein
VPQIIAHDTYTFHRDGKWQWRCLTCDEASSQTWRFRVDTDEDATDHVQYHLEEDARRARQA